MTCRRCLQCVQPVLWSDTTFYDGSAVAVMSSSARIRADVEDRRGSKSMNKPQVRLTAPASRISVVAWFACPRFWPSWRLWSCMACSDCGGCLESFLCQPANINSLGVYH